MDQHELFSEPDIDFDLPFGLPQNKYIFRSCLKIEDGYAAYLMSESDSGKLYLLKRADDPVLALSLANEMNMLSTIHNSSQTEIANTFPHAGYYASDGKTTWYIRSYIKGQTLSELVELGAKKPGLPRNQALGYIIQTAELLNFLHTLTPPIIHRDIKPQNVVVDDCGICHLIDMGISRLFDADKKEDTVVMGTRQTAPPEQFGFQQTDARSDIYSLGVLLYYCITGDYLPLDGKLSDIDPDIAEVVLKATKFDPSSRYQSAKELINDLISLRWKDSDAAKLIDSAKPAPKKKKILYTIAAMLSAIALCVLTVFVCNLPVVRAFFDGSSEFYTFKEPVFEEAVREMLDKPLGGISRQDLESIQYISICGKQGLRSLSSIYINADGVAVSDGRYYNNTRIFEKGNITDFSDLFEMPNLKTLSLANQHLEDVSFLNNLQVEQLNLDYCTIDDITPLYNCDNINSFTLIGTILKSWSFLKYMSALSMIDVSYSNFSSLSDLNSERIYLLNILNCDINDLEKLESFDSISHFTGNYSPETIKYLSDNTLYYLSLTYDDEFVLDGLGAFSFLEQLTLNSKTCAELNFDNIGSFTHVHFLSIKGTIDGFESMSKAFPCLQSLQIWDAKLTGCDGFEDMKYLTYISCNDLERSILEMQYPDNPLLN